MKNSIKIGKKVNTIPEIEQGSFWEDPDDEAVLMVASVGVSSAVLVALDDGNFQALPVKVKDLGNISSTEWLELTGGKALTRITTPITITPEEV